MYVRLPLARPGDDTLSSYLAWAAGNDGGRMTSMTIKEADQTVVQRPTPLDCAHYWMLESANGPCSAGTCTRCGVTREFSNSTESVMWERSEDRAARPVDFASATKGEIRLSDDR